MTRVRPQHDGNSDTRIPPDATARTSADFDDGTLPRTLDALSGPLFLALRAGDEDAASRQHLFPFCTHVFFKHAANTDRVRSASAERFQPVSLRLQMVSEDWTAVMCSLCQHGVPIGEA
jgi:hypothetical protein